MPKHQPQTSQITSETEPRQAISSTKKPQPHPNKTYRQHHRAIACAISQTVAERNINIGLRDICRRAHITAPTFYAHYPNINAAYHSLEHALTYEFRHNLPDHPQHDIAYTVLLSFTRRHRAYFRPAFRNHDYHILHQLLDHIQHAPTNRPPTYFLYLQSLTSIVVIWALYDNFSAAKTAAYVQKLQSVRLMRFQLP